MTTRGAYAPLLIRSPPKGFASFKEMYGAQNRDSRDWLMGQDALLRVRILTAAPEIAVLDSVPELNQRGIVFSIAHRFVDESLLPYNLLY
jgi:hypothetical protein